jgi:protein-L-isoaspartate(D-aspartate) O-methyltransferase
MKIERSLVVGSLLVSFVMIFGLMITACASRVDNGPWAEDSLEKRRREMVAAQLESREITDRQVLEAMRKVPRHMFVPAELSEYAYSDSPLPIGKGQTISQPYIVALMTQTAAPKPQHRALEIGTGSGYQAAVLAELVKEVYSIEIVPELYEQSRRLLLEDLGYENVYLKHGDGYKGWPEQGPFDIILVTAAAERIPDPLLEQLAEGGRLVMPIGTVQGVQTLTLVTKRNGRIDKRFVTGVRFVPMTGQVQEKN